jgi:ABC-type antimicrobial peptide transport system permease subunit
VTKDLAEHSQAPVEDPKTWNFLLISTPNPVKAAAILEEALKAASSPLQVRDWRDTAGGNAKIVWFIQLLFNLGLVFVSLIAGLIVMNSMSLAVAERSQEIGTLRSLGASRAFVGKLISYETVILVAGAGILGVAAGVFVILGLHLRGGVSVSNPFLATLLGTNRYSPSLSWVLVAEHFALSFALGLVATILPVKRALQVSPRQAMARE